jgi:hypothetical protein
MTTGVLRLTRLEDGDLANASYREEGESGRACEVSGERGVLLRL